MLQRLRRPCAVVAHRSRWTAPLSKLLLSSTAESAPLSVSATVAFADTSNTTKASKKYQSQSQKQFALLAPALTTFREYSGHWIVPYRFSIPTTSDPDQIVRKGPGASWRVIGLIRHVSEIPWSEQVRGLNLGRVLDKFMTNIDHQMHNPHVVEQLQEIGFPAKQSWREYKWKHQTFAALQTFFDIHGHSMPYKFKVPRDDTLWPVVTWGLPLGEISIRMRQCRDKWTPHELADLESIDFSFDVAETTWSDKILPSLEVFAQVYGHCRVERAFVVPRESPWPTKVWGLNLGSNVDSIRSKKVYVDQVARDVQRLEAINFAWNVIEHRWSEIILPSLKVFREVYGHCHVPTNFLAPAQAPWPEDAWGVKLGIAVATLRSDGTFAEQVARDAAELEAIGFVWNVKQDRWENIVLPALECFHQVHGHLKIPRKFVVPSEASWPETAWGLRAWFSTRDHQIVWLLRGRARARPRAAGSHWLPSC